MIEDTQKKEARVKRVKDLSPEECRREFDYREGKLYRRPRALERCHDEAHQRRVNTQFANKEAGCIKPDGYVRVRVMGTMHQAHRIIYAMHHGPIPDGSEVDHVNGNPSDNRIENLRLASRSQNNQNRTVRRDSTTGIKGVYRRRDGKKWVAEIKVEGKKIHLGNFLRIEDAQEAVRAAREGTHREFAHHG